MLFSQQDVCVIAVTEESVLHFIQVIYVGMEHIVIILLASYHTFCVYFMWSVKLGIASEIVAAEWGDTSNPLFHDSSINTIICFPDKNTMMTAKPSGWLSYLLHKVGVHKAADIFSNSK